jgi:PAS domain S-box-containing protein
VIDGKINSVNRVFTELSGFSEEDVKEKSTSILWKRWEDREELVRKLKLTGCVVNFETTFVKKNGKDIHAMITSSIIILDGETYVLSAIKEVHERRLVDRRADRR